MLRGRNGKAGEVREACLVDLTPDFLRRQEWQSSTDNGHYWRRSDHPSSSMPVAATQLPATRTAIRAHAARSDMTWLAAMAITTKTTVAVPTSALPTTRLPERSAVDSAEHDTGRCRSVAVKAAGRVRRQLPTRRIE
jgi:hypothetical protein